MRYLREIREVFDAALGPEAALAIDENADMESVPGWDSQCFIELVLQFEQKFSVNLDTAEAVSMYSVAAMNDYLVARFG